MASRTSVAMGAALAIAALASFGAASAASISSDALARNIAGVAHSAEAAHKGGATALEGEVQTATQDLISVAAAPPSTVKGALESVLKICSAPPAKQEGLDCPSQAASFSALRKLLAVVDGLVQDAAGDTSLPQTLDIVPLPIPGGGGSDYRRTP